MATVLLSDQDRGMSAISRQSFQDFGHYREGLRCWHTEAYQISRGPLNLQFDCLDTAHLVLSHLRYDRAASIQSRRDASYCSLSIHFSPKVWCGMQLPATGSLTIVSGRETHVVSHEPFDAINITVSRDMLASWEDPVSRLAEWDRPPDQSILPFNQNALDAFRAWTESLFATPMMPASRHEKALWTDALVERVKWHLLQIIGQRTAATAVSALHQVARYDLVLAALGLLQQRQEHRFTVRELASTLGVSSRALQYAFGCVLGMTPLQYLLAERLNQARHRLWDKTAGFGSITEIAFDYKFENLSRFCSQYKRLFGERPSDTLRAARSAIAGP
ncbi:helix-turn-helix domain-containing protein [Vineibacter terrae]|uniref:helix-turn-helix domain-containing protein n=1 Tax=Vineibacter terrae TaxID=2586908 RepID=UPI002E322A6B|nr:helix-turn-helix domain-containing protein [Vineibacter terrae]HEX2889292.1 helix-turn-helix domain-containing protein [Vineibacter terrae]